MCCDKFLKLKNDVKNGLLHMFFSLLEGLGNMTVVLMHDNVSTCVF